MNITKILPVTLILICVYMIYMNYKGGNISMVVFFTAVTIIGFPIYILIEIGVDGIKDLIFSHKKNKKDKEK